jgi:surface polysaccharide O-acyltransferase-like enzyme
MTGKGTLLEFYLSSLDSCRLARLLLVGAPPVGGFHLWFVSALVFCYAVLYVYVRFFEGERVEYNYLYCVSVCLLAGFYYSDSIMDLSGAEYIDETMRNGLFLGLPCFSLGLFLHEHQERIFRNFSWSNRRSLALIALGLAVSLLQQFGTGKAELPLGMMLVVPTLFLFCVQNPTLPERIPLLAQLAPWAGRLSMWIFVLHILVYRQLEALAGRVESVEWMISQRAPVPETVWVMLFTTLLSIAPCFLAQRVGEARKKRRCGKPSCGRE